MKPSAALTIKKHEVQLRVYKGGCGLKAILEYRVLNLLPQN